MARLYSHNYTFESMKLVNANVLVHVNQFIIIHEDVEVSIRLTKKFNCLVADSALVI